MGAATDEAGGAQFEDAAFDPFLPGPTPLIPFSGFGHDNRGDVAGGAPLECAKGHDIGPTGDGHDVGPGIIQRLMKATEQLGGWLRILVKQRDAVEALGARDEGPFVDVVVFEDLDQGGIHEFANGAGTGEVIRADAVTKDSEAGGVGGGRGLGLG